MRSAKRSAKRAELAAVRAEDRNYNALSRGGLLTTPEIIELAKRKLTEQLRGTELDGGELEAMTDYRFANLMNFRQQTVSSWMTGRTRIAKEYAATFGRVTGLGEEFIYACVEHERETDPTVRRILRRVAEHFKGNTAAIALTVGITALAAAPGPSQAATGPVARFDANIHYANWRTRRRHRRRRSRNVIPLTA